MAHCIVCNKPANDNHVNSGNHIWYVDQAWRERQADIRDMQASRSAQPAIMEVQASASAEFWQPPPLPQTPWQSHAAQSTVVDSGLQSYRISVDRNSQPAPPVTPPPGASPNIIELQACGPAAQETWPPPPPTCPPPSRSEAPPANASCPTTQNHCQPPPPTSPPPQEGEVVERQFSVGGTWEPAPPTTAPPAAVVQDVLSVAPLRVSLDVPASSSSEHWQPLPLPPNASQSHAAESTLVYSAPSVEGNFCTAPPVTPHPGASPKAPAATTSDLQLCRPAVQETGESPPPTCPLQSRSEAPPANASCPTMQNHGQPPPPNSPPPQEREFFGKFQIFVDGIWELAPPTTAPPSALDTQSHLAEGDPAGD